MIMNDLLDNHKSCPYYQLIYSFKYYIHQKNNSNQNGKYSSITNHNHSLLNDINSQKNKNLIVQNTNKSFYYYDPFPSLQSPILLIALISFHHKKAQ